MLERMTVRNRLSLLVAVPLLAFIVIVVLALADMRALNRTSAHIYEDLEDISLLQQTQDAFGIRIVDNFNRYHSGLITRNQLQTDVQRHIQTGRRAWQEFRSLPLSGEEQRMARSLDTHMEQSAQLAQRLLRQTDLRAMGADGLTRELGEVFDPLTQELRELMRLQVSESAQLYADSERRYEQDLVLFVSIAGATLFITLLLAWFIFRSIQQPVDRLGEVMTQVAKESDLSIRAPVSGNNELSLLGRRFNAMMDSFREVILNVSSASEQVATASEELSSVSEEVSNIAQAQEEQTTQIATAITEMAAAVEEVAKSAQSALGSSEQAEREATNGRADVTRNMQAMEQLSDSVMGAAERLTILDERTQEIAKVMDVIQGIAEQTNLLALNAAIEAARAGEQGRGFAVVADEVRALASNTKDSTATIQDTTERLRRGANEAVEAMNTSANQAKESLGYARKTGESFEQVNVAVGEVVEVNVQISTATEQQATVANDITENVNGLSDSIAEVVTGAHQCASASTELSGLAQQLRDQVSRFKVA